MPVGREKRTARSMHRQRTYYFNDDGNEGGADQGLYVLQIIFVLTRLTFNYGEFAAVRKLALDHSIR